MESVNPDRCTVTELIHSYLKETVLPLDNTPPIEINARLLHAILGIVDEAGELTSWAKRILFYKKEPDMINLKEELGDVWWFFNLALDEIAKIENNSPAEIFSQIINMNRVKLHSRYLGAGKYSQQGALNRNLAQERRLMEEAAKGNLIG